MALLHSEFVKMRQTARTESVSSCSVLNRHRLFRCCCDMVDLRYVLTHLRQQSDLLASAHES